MNRRISTLSLLNQDAMSVIKRGILGPTVHFSKRMMEVLKKEKRIFLLRRIILTPEARKL